MYQKQTKENKINIFTGNHNEDTQKVNIEITLQKLIFTLYKKINNSCNIDNISFKFF